MTMTVLSSITGLALLKATTLTVTVEVAVPPLPSSTSTVNESMPAKPVAGV